LYDEKNNKIEVNIEDKIEEELDSVIFLRSIRSLSPLQSTRDYYYNLITEKQKKTLQLLQQLNLDMASSNFNRTSSDRIPISVTTQDVNLSNNYIKENLRIPKLTGLKTPAISSQINKSIENDIMEFKRQMEESAKESEETAKKTGSKFIPYSISNIYDITFNKNNIISLTILYHEYVSGKNYYIKTSYNYDTSTGKALSIGDLFKPGTNYKEIIDNLIRKQLYQNKNQYFPGSLENFKGIAEDQPFYLEDNNLIVFFGFNEIAPLQSQIPTVKIPLSQLQNSLKPQFL
jgi:hypothetical protein